LRICMFSERLSPPFDEGIKSYALHLARSLAADHKVLALTALGADIPEMGVRNVASNRLLLAPALAAKLLRFRPQLIIYVPTASATLFSFLRARLLKAYGRGARVALLTLQPREHGRLAQLLMPRLQPDLVLVQAERTRVSLSFLDGEIGFFPPGIDTERFRPGPVGRRLELRRLYGLKPEDYVLLHVGHLNRGRNIQALCDLQRVPGNQVLVVGSTSTPQDSLLVQELRDAGLRVISDYVSDIVEIYQLADCYLFPVVEESRCIDVPLSVLEAMACDLPVVTTRYGGLPLLFSAGAGFCYMDDVQGLTEAVEACKRLRWPGTRCMVRDYDWTRIGPWLLDSICRRLRLNEGHKP